MAQRKHRQHALRVAGVTTLIVLAFYVVAVVVLNEVVTHHLITTADNRLRDRLNDARQQMSAPQRSPVRDDDDTDVDDAPQFLWTIAPSGRVTALTSTAPPLPQRHWDANPVTLAVGTSNVRFDTLRVGDRLLLAGESAASISNVQSALLVAELVFGCILAVVVFGGATVVGLRASAPSELVRQRQAEFTADASHELRTPISVIEAEIGLALDRPRDPAEYREALQRVGRESNRLRRIVEDLLWLARADDEIPLADGTSLADVGGEVEGSVERFGALAASQGVKLSFEQVGSGRLLVQASAALVDRQRGQVRWSWWSRRGERQGLRDSREPASGRLWSGHPRKRARSRARPIPSGHGDGGRDWTRPGHCRFGRSFNPRSMDHRHR